MQRCVHQQFGFVAGDQHVRIHPEFQTIELRFPKDVPHGFVTAAPAQPFVEARRCCGAKRMLGVRIEPGPALPHSLGEEQLRAPARLGYAGSLQYSYRSPEDLTDLLRRFTTSGHP